MHIHVFIKNNTSGRCDKQEMTIKELPVLENYYILVLFTVLIYLFVSWVKTIYTVHKYHILCYMFSYICARGVYYSKGKNCNVGSRKEQIIFALLRVRLKCNSRWDHFFQSLSLIHVRVHMEKRKPLPITCGTVPIIHLLGTEPDIN